MWRYAFLSPTPPGGEKRLLVWLRDRLAAHDVPALGPHAGEEGWTLSINADDGYVFIRLDASDGGTCAVIIDHVGAAEVEAEDAAEAVAAILSAGPALRMVAAA